MDKLQALEATLDKARDDFSAEIRQMFEEGSNRPATEGDLAELAKQTFYAFGEMKNAIITYLKH